MKTTEPKPNDLNIIREDWESTRKFRLRQAIATLACKAENCRKMEIAYFADRPCAVIAKDYGISEKQAAKIKAAAKAETYAADTCDELARVMRGIATYGDGDDDELRSHANQLSYDWGTEIDPTGTLLGMARLHDGFARDWREFDDDQAENCVIRNTTRTLDIIGDSTLLECRTGDCPVISAAYKDAGIPFPDDGYGGHWCRAWQSEAELQQHLRGEHPTKKECEKRVAGYRRDIAEYANRPAELRKVKPIRKKTNARDKNALEHFRNLCRSIHNNGAEAAASACFETWRKRGRPENLDGIYLDLVMAG